MTTITYNPNRYHTIPGRTLDPNDPRPVDFGDRGYLPRTERPATRRPTEAGIQRAMADRAKVNKLLGF